MSDTPNVDEQPQHNLEDVVYDMLSETFCPDCDHPRCKRKVELYTSALQSIITQAKQQTCDDIVGLLPSDSVVTKEYGYHSDEKKFGFRIGITATIEAIKQYREGL